MFRHPLKFVLHSALLASLLANAAAIHLLRAFHAREWLVRRHPIATGPWPTTGLATAPTVLLLGDSRIRLWPAIESTDLRIVNAGAGGETTAQILLRIDAVLAETRPKVVVIEAGINDLRTIPLFPNEADAIERTCRENLCHIVDLCRSTGAAVVLMPIWKTGDIPLWQRPLWNDRAGQALTRINRSLAASSPSGASLWLDTDALLTKADFRDPWHLRRDAYSRLERPLKEAVAHAMASP